MAESLEKTGEFAISDFAKIGRPEQSHLAFRALLAFQDKHNGQLPEVANEAHATEVLQLAKEINEQAKAKVSILTAIVLLFFFAKGKQQQNANQSFEERIFEVDQVDEDVIKKVALFARGDISPMVRT